MTNGRIFFESVLDLPEIILVPGILIVAVWIARDLWPLCRGPE